MGLNGKTYEMQYLTDEETAVINAMRMGAEINAYFFNSSVESVTKHREALGENAYTETVRNLGEGDAVKFDSYDIHIGKKTTIYHFIDK